MDSPIIRRLRAVDPQDISRINFLAAALGYASIEQFQIDFRNFLSQ